MAPSHPRHALSLVCRSFHPVSLTHFIAFAGVIWPNIPLSSMSGLYEVSFNSFPFVAVPKYNFRFCFAMRSSCGPEFGFLLGAQTTQVGMTNPRISRIRDFMSCDDARIIHDAPLNIGQMCYILCIAVRQRRLLSSMAPQTVRFIYHNP